MSESPADRASRQLPVVFIHGAGRSGVSAWPAQRHLASDRECLFLERLLVAHDPGTVVADLAKRFDSAVHVVAHSYGGVAAMLMAATRPDLVASLTLVEPAALALSAEAPNTAAHIAALTPVFARAGDPTVSAREFATLFAKANGTPVPDVPDEVLENLTGQIRALRPPWSFPVDAKVVNGIPTLVLIGDDDGMYSEVAEVLKGEGAIVHVFAGAGHRPHDGAEATGLMVAHWAWVEAQQ
ncbi:MAG: alpha/beta fold hydrolase [Terracoccus sp.]